MSGVTMVNTQAALKPIPTRPERLAEMVYDAIRDAIVASRLAPGDQVTEAALAEQLAVSKTPVREALQQLEYIGLVESDGRRGARIVVPSRERIKCAYEIRLAFDVQAARLVAARGSKRDLSAIARAAQDCLDAASEGDRDGFRAFDRDFHLLIGKATGNPQLSKLLHDAFDLTWTLRRRDVPMADDSLACAKQHMRILEAMNQHNEQAAEDAVRAHVTKVQGMVLAGFDSPDLQQPETARPPVGEGLAAHSPRSDESRRGESNP
jgi:DNA-binding GntR family transcriptional regulator